MTQFDKIYIDIVKNILDNGIEDLDPRSKYICKALPGIHFNLDLSKGFPLLSLRKLPLKIFTAEPKPGKRKETPGTIGADTSCGLSVAAADGYVILKEVQLAGKKQMSITEFLRGYRLQPKTILQ